MIDKGRVQNIVVMGKSGAGKQPRIDVLTSEFGLRQLSTGNIFREYVGAFDRSGYKGDLERFYDPARDTFVPDQVIIDAIKAQLPDVKDARPVMLGLKAKYFMNSGKFVPNSSTNELFKEYFSRGGYKGFVLDGYPRTPDQSRFLLDLCREHGVRVDLVLLVENEDELIVERTMGRRICKGCGKVYHIKFKPSKDNVHCDACGKDLIQRSDDTEAKIRTRLQEYYDKALPALKILEDAGIPVAKVPGNLPVFTDAAVRESVISAIRPFVKEI
jgi:adenylate kinase